MLTFAKLKTDLDLIRSKMSLSWRAQSLFLKRISGMQFENFGLKMIAQPTFPSTLSFLFENSPAVG